MPATLRVCAEGITAAGDLAYTSEWFGSGGRAFRPVVASDRVVALARSRKWRGVRWSRIDLVS